MAFRVLVVEDDEDARALLVDLLHTYGYEVVEAADGEQAKSRLVSDRPDVVILDMSLPVKLGWEVAEEIRRTGAESIPIIGLSGYTSQPDREKALSAGCTAYLNKPCRPLEIIAEIERLLGSGRSDSLPP